MEFYIGLGLVTVLAIICGVSISRFDKKSRIANDILNMRAEDESHNTDNSGSA